MTKIQFNTKSASNFRKVLGKYHNARHELANYIATHDKALKDAREAHDKDVKQLFAMQYGKDEEKKEIVRTLEEIKKSFAETTAIVRTLEDNLSKAKDKSNKACEDAQNLITEELYKGYLSIGENANEFADAIAKWFIANGLTDANRENCMPYTWCVGTDSGKNGSKKVCETGHLRKRLNKKQFTETWLGALVDRLQDDKIINAYKYTYKPENK